MLCVQVAIPRPIDQLYTYRVPEEWASRIRRGLWVRVPFGRTTTHGYLLTGPSSLEATEVAPEKLKSVLEVGADDLDVPEDVLKLCEWAHRYYMSPIGEVLGAAVPAAALGLKNKKAARDTPPVDSEMQRRTFELNSAQQKAVEILRNSEAVALLEGVTGSGKTEVYLTLAREHLAGNRGVIFLVPEISLTPQLHHRLEAALGENVVLWHSAMSDGQRRDAWSALRRGQARVVVGARSAIFAPVQALGLIVVDEEHDASYKQEDRVRYHARDLSVVRGQISAARVVLGSATPSLETLERVRQGRWTHAKLPERYHRGGLPDLTCIDLTVAPLAENTRGIWAKETLEAVGSTLAAGHQVLIFMNRRGFANFLVCEACGHVPRCEACSVSLTVHKKDQRLKCHHCGFSSQIRVACPECSGGPFRPVGAGTESLEDDLTQAVPEARILRLDRDQITSHQRLETILNDFRSGKGNVLLGTQMVVKGHDFPDVALVVVMLADALFHWPDFRAAERAFQTLTQVAGRAGRGSVPGRVLIQTYNPSHPVLRAVSGEDSVEAFLDSEREVRQALGFPPFGRLARLRVEGKSAREADAAAKRLADSIPPVKGLSVLGPVEAALEQLRGVFRRDILLKAERAEMISSVIPSLQLRAREDKISLLVDLDPTS